MRLFAALLAGLFCVPQIAMAAPREVGASTWSVFGDDIVLSYTFSRSLAARLASADRAAPSTQTIAHYVFSKVSVQRQGAPCDAVDQGYDLGRVDTRYVGPEVLSFEIFFRCVGKPGALILRNDSFLDRSPGQISIATVWVAGMPPVSRLVTRGHAAIHVDAAQVPEPSGPGAYVGLGLRHALTTMVCLCTSLGLLLLLRSRREFPALLGGLVAGYLLAALAATAGWTLQGKPAQAFGGFLVLLFGALLTARGSGRLNAAAIGLAAMVGTAAVLVALLGHAGAALCLAGAGMFGALLLPLQRGESTARWLLPALGVLVGTLDGFSLASMFEPLRAVVAVEALHLFAYNGGALLGILAIFATASGAWILLRRFAGWLRAPICRDLLTACLAAAGAFSMLSI